MKFRRIDFYPDDWLAGTNDLGPNEGWAYMQICALIYSRGAPIPDDEAWISRVCNMHWRTFRAARARLIELRKIILANGHITVARCEAELAKARARSEQATENGNKGGRPPSSETPHECVMDPPETVHDGFIEPSGTPHKPLKNGSGTVQNALNDYGADNENNYLAKPDGSPSRAGLLHLPPSPSVSPDADASGVPRSARRPKPKPPSKMSIADGWEPDASDFQYAADRGHNEGWINDQAESFRDHAVEKARMCADWHAAWRNWVRKAEEFGARGPPNGKHQPSAVTNLFNGAYLAAEAYNRRHGLIDEGNCGDGVSPPVPLLDRK